MTRKLYHPFFILVLCTPLACSTAQPRKVPATPAQGAIDRSIAYFRSMDDQIAPDAYLVYQYLKDRYDLPTIGTRGAFMRKLKEDTALYVGYQPFFSFMEPIPFDPAFLVNGDGSDPVMVAGLWYDELPDKELLNTLISGMDWNEGYMITHALLARSVAQQQFGARPAAELDSMLFQCSIDIIEAKRPLWGDLQIEALAFIQYARPEFEVDSIYIEEIIALQNADGSWSTEGEYPGIADHHTTVLALWALLAYDPATDTGRKRPLVLR